MSDRDGREEDSGVRLRVLEAALREIAREAAAARSALCENELVIRLDTILDRCAAALDRSGGAKGE